MRTDIPALSLRQPWAWAVLYAGKWIENRTWSTGYRGRILLHAAKTWDSDGETWLTEQGLIVPSQLVCRDKRQMGAYVGEVEVTNCVRYDTAFAAGENPWAFGPVCWVLTEPAAYRQSVPGRGFMGLYDVRTGRAWPAQPRR